MKIDVRNFIYDNITPYDGDESFLVGPSERTKKLWEQCKKLLEKEKNNGGILDIDTETISTVSSHQAGYIDKDLELIVGLQTDAPLKRAIKPFGGYRVVEKACAENEKELSPKVKEIFTKYRKSHNDGIFDAYTPSMLTYRKTGILTGLPDNYSRGRIIGDYRRLALYGIDNLIEAKEEDKIKIINPQSASHPAPLEKEHNFEMTEDVIRLREEISEQIKALKEIKEMAIMYGFDISKPAKNATEAVQRTYFGFLAAIKEQDGAAMSLGNVSSFLDIFIEKDLKEGKLNEEQAQELIDQFVIKLRLVRQLRMSEYNQLFAGDPTWTTESIGGIFQDGKHKITKTSFRFLQTLYNLGAAPEPNLTILWSKDLPKGFKKFATKVSIDTSSIQYENDDMMRKIGCTDDYGIACCVSQLETGKWMQFFGARCNLAKALLLTINGGKDEITGTQILDDINKIPDINKSSTTSWSPSFSKGGQEEILKYEEVWEDYKKVLSELAREYVNTMNIIHYMHDKYYYEKSQMAFMDSIVKRYMAFGAAGLSVVADSLSAIKFAKVKVIRYENGLSKDFEIEGDFPKYGNDNDEADQIAVDVVKYFIEELRKHKIYRDAEASLSILTITANVVYGHKTGATPDGRKAGEPFAPGANPMHGRDSSGAIASLNSVAKISYEDAKDGISNTFSVVPITLGINTDEQTSNLVDMLDGYFAKGGHHLNVNVLNRDTLLDAMEHPELYPQLTIRVSGYAVNFVKLSREQQEEVIARTFHERM
ncbi:formate C-acetyltransferase [Candidatus Gracilibacteria bacterium]|nr:formate C-acetyltransferase [Candidatus Gracilibacteria bacterium]